MKNLTVTPVLADHKGAVYGDSVKNDLSEVFMHMSNGMKYYPFDPRPEDVSVEVIAHHLASRARWNGATTHPVYTDRIFYSVAEHSVYVAKYLMEEMDRPDLVLSGLFHDASEAYNGDLIRPLKYSSAFSAPFKQVEDKNEAAVNLALNLPHPIPNEVKIADDAVCAAEAQQIINRDTSLDWPDDNLFSTENVAPYEIRMLSPYDAKREFLGYYRVACLYLNVEVMS